MKTQLYILTLEVTDSEIYYYWNYRPEVRNVCGGIGYVFPNGTLYDIEYETLRSLGSGTHEIYFDEHIPSVKGNCPDEEDIDQSNLRRIKLTLFSERFGAYTATEVFFKLIFSFSPTLAKKIFPLLDDINKKRLVEFAAEIPPNITIEQAERFEFLFKSGPVTVPIENLKTIKEYFGD